MPTTECVTKRAAMIRCKHCQRELPDELFEQYPGGTRRKVCRQCKYLLYGVAAKRRWCLRQKAAAIAREAARLQPEP